MSMAKVDRNMFKRCFFGNILFIILICFLLWGIIILIPKAQNVQAYSQTCWDIAYRQGLQDIPSVQYACNNYDPSSGERGMLWFANTYSPASPVIESNQEWGEIGIGLFGAVYPSAAWASWIKANGAENVIYNHNYSLEGWIPDLWRPAFGDGLGSSNATLNIDNFKATATSVIQTDRGIEYSRPIPVWRCFGIAPQPDIGGRCYSDDIWVRLVIRGFNAYFESESTIQEVYQEDGQQKVRQETTSPRNGRGSINIVTNEKRDGETDPKDTGTTTLKYSHKLFRTDGNGQGRNAIVHNQGVTSDKFREQHSWGINERDTTMAPYSTYQDDVMAEKDQEFTFSLDLGKRADTNNPICQYLNHDSSVLMHFDGYVLSRGQWVDSGACATVGHPYNFLLTDDITLNPSKKDEGMVYAGESATANYNIYSAPKDDDRAHTDSPASTEIKAVSFTTSGNLDLGNLEGGHISASDGPEKFWSDKGFNNVREAAHATRAVPTEGLSNQTFDINVDDVEVGTKFCVAVAVSPSDSGEGEDRGYDGHLNTDWTISNASCRTIAKKPLAAAKIGQVYAGGGIETTASTKVNLNKTFGSWAEYTALSKNDIDYLGSGAVLAKGSPQSTVCSYAYSPLSIANSQCQAGSGQTSKRPGQATGAINNNAFLTRILQLYDSVPRWTSGEIGGQTLASGDGELVIYADNPVTITGDIHVTGSYKSSTQVPQVIIIAPHINIADNVLNVDAWLIAYGDKTTHQGGIVNTCPIFERGSSGTEICSEQLMINGPVFAQQLLLNRNHGAGPENDSSTPAETINLTPAAYEWGYGSSRNDKDAQVFEVYDQELPPRL